MPVRKITGKKTTQKVTVEIRTGPATSRAPWSAASKLASPCSIRRTIASTTTID